MTFRIDAFSSNSSSLLETDRTQKQGRKKSPIFLLAEETTQTKDETNLRHTAAAKQARKIIDAKNKRKVKRMSEVHNRWPDERKRIFPPSRIGMRECDIQN
ncbi:hypothetical protein CEXT_37011 [Caerostris extrusa]|uniref:Uncharacterized protein n=1 Tax=Caerostris extrusa TaxID=172846 RepID=A0AAV4ULZ5_CAEEX|nr:hypothetical protein CEXT_37011 [Caerostris extrusa]